MAKQSTQKNTIVGSYPNYEPPKENAYAKNVDWAHNANATASSYKEEFSPENAVNGERITRLLASGFWAEKKCYGGYSGME